jgi:superfamily II DNA/RNA helicase
LVLDEADRLCSPSFQEEVDLVFNLLKITRKREQSLRKILVSATFPKTTQLRLNSLLQSTNTNSDNRYESLPPVSHLVCMEKGINDSTKTALPSTIMHRVINLEEESRTQALIYLIENSDLQEWSKVLCFVGTRYQSELVAKVTFYCSIIYALKSNSLIQLHATYS